MKYEEVRELFLHHLKYSGANEAKAHEIYHDDVILEFPQSGERFGGKTNIQGFREQYPATHIDFEPREIRGSGDFWIAEGRISYNEDDPINFVWVAQFRGALVQRETIYFGEPFPALDWRKPWAEAGTARRSVATFQPASAPAAVEANARSSTGHRRPSHSRVCSASCARHSGHALVGCDCLG
jgi:hypothetical protein